MHKVFFFLVSILWFVNAKTQEIQFKCYLKSNCNNSIILLDNFSIKKNEFIYYSLNNGPIANLPDTGTYILKSPKIPEDSVLVSIDTRGLNIDTLKQKDVFQIVFIDTKPSKDLKNGDWVCCNKKCEGYKIEYYTNGNKYFEGRFKNGKPTGIFRYYSLIGKLKLIVQYDKNGEIIKKTSMGN